MQNTTHKSISKDHGQEGLIEYFTREFWSLVGNILLFFIALAILKTKSLFTLLDLFYWITVFSLVTVRYYDIRCLKGITAMGLPATMANWRKYAIYLILASAALWITAKTLGFLK